MSIAPVSIAFVPLVDAAPLIVASELGFDREEGLKLDLVRASSWSSVRDMLAFGRVEAAHLLSPVPVAMAMGLGSVSAPISALMVLSVNGNVIGLSTAMADRLRSVEPGLGFHDAAAVGRALVKAAGQELRIGVPFPFSMHAELLYYWLSASGRPSPQSVEIRTIPPSLMADALAAGDIDAFCVGEPWGSQTIDRGLGELILPGSAIWSFAPEKVLAVRTAWAEEEPHLTARLMRAVWKACRWLGQGGAQTTAAEILAHKQYLDLPAETLDRALTGRLVVSATNGVRNAESFVEFYNGAATFPWRSQAAWIAYQIAGRLGLDRQAAMQQASATFRSDLYRRNLEDVGAILPGASSKIEGGLVEETGVAAQNGHLILKPNAFFDGQVFDPGRGI